jgi:peptide chain release factor subunit 1
MGETWLSDERQLRKLVEADAGSVVSLYLDLDPSRFAVPKGRAAQVESLLDEARHRYTDSEEHRPLQLDSAVARDLERVRSYVGLEFEPAGARGVAVFCASDTGLFEVLRSERSVRPAAVVDERPHVRPLVEAQPPAVGWFVLLVSRTEGRILADLGAGLRELERIGDEVHGRHDQGGWSQARYQRHISEQVKEHVRGVCGALYRTSRRRPVGRLLVGAPTDLRPLVEADLHPDQRRLLAGWLQVDVEHSNRAEIEAAAQEQVRQEQEAADERLLAALRGGRGEANEPVAAGMDQVLDALNERRLATFVFDRGSSEPGVLCRSCGWLGRSGRRCAVDGAELEPVEDLVERMVRAALTQSASVRALEGLNALGGVAALLRPQQGR